jgi:hypothetical protein
MPTTLPATAGQKSEGASRLERCLFAAYCIALAAVCGLLVVNGPNLRAAADAKEALIAEEENKAFCGTFGIGPETSRYAQCAAELAAIRARHLQRNFGDSIL